MDSLESLVVGEKGCTVKEVVDVFCKEVNSVTVLNRWTDFARELNISSLDIEEWRQEKLLNKLTLKDILHKIIESWKREKGKDATLKDLLNHLENVHLKNVADDCEKFFSTENRAQMAGEHFKGMLPKKPDYYISRTLVTRSVINVKVLSSNKSDVFVIDGIDRNRLSQLAKKELTDISSEQVRKDELSVRFIQLNRVGDWALLCDKTTKPIHLLRYHAGRFHCICTKGDISALQNAIEEKTQNELSEKEFIQEIETDSQFQANQPIFISDSPGMGKSLLLASIGRQLQHLHPQRFIAFIVVSEFVAIISEMLPQFDNKEKAVVEAILHILSENDSARDQIFHKIRTPKENSCTQVELMFDGFDEVSSENYVMGLDCLKMLTGNFNSTVRIWITTRPQHLHELENRFLVLGYNIKAFHKKNQIDFLTSYWNSQQNNLDKCKLETFSKNCISTLKKKLNKKDDDDIAGIPLQCMMIAEVYMQDALLFCNSKNGNIENRPETVPSIHIKSIADLYKKTIKHKIGKFIKTYGVQQKQIDLIWRWHMYLALQLIFPNHAHKFIKDTLQPLSGLKQEDLENSGILVSRGRATREPARFVHKTFAEYFVARLFVSHFVAPSATDPQNCNRTLPNHLFEHMLESSVQEHHSWATTYHQCSFKHPVLCYFINALLGSTTHIPAKQRVSEKSTKYIKDVIYACIHSDFGNIVKFLRGLKYPENFINSIFNSESEILIDATRVASLDLLKFLMENFKHKALTKIWGKHNKMPTALHAAVRRGNYSIFEYIFKEHQFKHLVKTDERFMNLVHSSVFDTAHRDLDEIHDRVQIIEGLWDLKKEMIDHCDENNRTPLLSTSIHILLLKKLIECGADLLHVNHFKDSILHHATYYMSTTDYYTLLQSIPIPTLMSLLRMGNENDDISFHLIVKRDFANQDILNFITSNGFDINMSGKRGRTGLFYALEMENEEMTIPTVKLLLEYGADLTRVCDSGESIVHYSALKGRIDCLKLFLEENNMNVNQKNCRGETPIFHALRNFHSALETVEFLIQRGSGYTILNSNQDNLLYHSAKYQQTECLEYFLSRGGQDINQTNNDGNTPLMGSLRWNNGKIVEVTRLLLDKGADHRISNKNGNNVLHRSAKIGSAEWFRNFAELQSLDVNARNCDQDTPLHTVFRNIRNYECRRDDYNSFLYIIEKLVSLGADVNAKNRYELTPLDIYEGEMLESKYNEELMKKDVTIRGMLEDRGQTSYPERCNGQ